VGARIQTTRENLPAVLRLVAEVLREPSFPENEFEQARQEMLAAVEMGRSQPMMLASSTVVRLLNPYPRGDSRYMPPFDEMAEMIKSARLDDVKRFHAQFYGASNGELAIVGDFDAEEAQTLAAKLFGDWNSPAKFKDVLRSYRKVEPLNQVLEMPDKANAWVYVGIPLSLSDEDSDYRALLLGNFMLGGNVMNSRLAVRLRQREGLSYTVASRLWAAPKENAKFSAVASCTPQNAPKVETALREEIARVLKDGFSEDELKAARQGWKESERVSRSQDAQLAMRLAVYAHWNRTMAFETDLEKNIEALTSARILEAFRKHIKMEDLFAVRAGDFKKAGVRF
jgi:zinc protease